MQFGTHVSCFITIYLGEPNTDYDVDEAAFLKKTFTIKLHKGFETTPRKRMTANDVFN